MSSFDSCLNPTSSPAFRFWPRVILLVDMNAFFASVEQRDFAELRARPVAITNGQLGSCIITCSYEARAMGIKTGMRLKEARIKCPELIQRPARPQVYAATSKAIMQALNEKISPLIEVFSVDEAFLDVTDGQKYLGDPKAIGIAVKDAVWQASNLLCSVGVSADKTTAKWAAKQNKPDGLTLVAPWQSEACLAPLEVDQLCGINKGVKTFLNQRGVYLCGDMKKIPISVLGQRFGNIGRRLWLMAQGKDPDPVNPKVKPPKSIGHGKVLPPQTKQIKVINTYLYHMVDKVAFRLRKNHMIAGHFFVGLRLENQWLKTKFRTVPTDTANIIYAKVAQFVKAYWRGQGVWAVQVTALNPYPQADQLDLFEQQSTSDLDRALDEINQRYGLFTVTKGCLLNRSKMPDVIAPAWKPDGHRQTID
jgi:DNA polymerase IV